MNLRLAIYELCEHHRLNALASRRLLELAKLDSEPATLLQTLGRGVAVLAAILFGLGIVFWIAANWESFGRTGRFALLQILFVTSCVGAWRMPALKVPLGLLALVAIGALFAYFGQTYQTGADPWQLFALWALLFLPLGLCVRSDALWTAWALVAMTGVALWIYAHSGHGWRVEAHDLPVHLIGWGVALMLTVALSPVCHRYTGAGLWSLRLSVTLAVLLATVTAVIGLFPHKTAPHYYFGLLMLAAGAVIFSRPLLFDIFNISAISLGFNAVVFGGMAKLLSAGGSEGNQAGSLLVLGLSAAAMLAVTVRVILKLSQAKAPQGATA